MSEEAAKKKSRRARRRASQQKTPGAEHGSPEEAPSKAASSRSSGKGRVEPEKSSSRQTSTTSIRDERLRARDTAAARRRKQRARERAQAAAEGLDTSELVDDALARGVQATTKFVQRHFKWLQWVIIGSLVGGIGLLIYNYRVELGNQKATARLIQGLNAELGQIEDPDSLDADLSGFVDSRPEFASHEARLKAAADAYQKTVDEDPNADRRTLARIGLAGVLFEQGKHTEAEKAYREVRDSALAAKELQLRGRSIEGMALSLEALDKQKEAGKAFKELENLGGPFTQLGQYHQARMHYQAGERGKAKELLTKILEKTQKQEPEVFAAPGFVTLAAQQLLEAIDPGAAKPAPGAGMTPEQLKRIQEQLRRASGAEGGGTDMKELMDAINKSAGEAPAGEAVPSAPETEAQQAPKPAPEEPAAPPEAPPTPAVPAAPEPPTVVTPPETEVTPAPETPQNPAPNAPPAPTPQTPSEPKPPLVPKAPAPSEEP